eukprot:gene8808-8987_t
MSVARYKEKLTTVIRLRSLQKQLTAENESLVRRRAALELLAQHQDTIASVLQQATGVPQPAPSYAPGDSSSWPLLSTLKSLNLAQFAHLKTCSIQDVATMWLSHLQQLALLLHWFQHSPEQALPMLNAAVGKALHLIKALYLLAPQLVYQLVGVNLMTGQKDPPPKEHWRACFEGCNATAEQVTQLQDLLAVVTPKLEALEQERQQVAATFSNDMQPLAAGSGPRLHSLGYQNAGGAGAADNQEPGGLMTRTAVRKQSSSSSKSQGTSSLTGTSNGSNAAKEGVPRLHECGSRGPTETTRGSATAARSGGSGIAESSSGKGASGNVERPRRRKQPASSQVQELHAEECDTVPGGAQTVNNDTTQAAAPAPQPAAGGVGQTTAAATTQAITTGRTEQAPSSATAGGWAVTLSAFDSPGMPALTRDMLNELHRKYLQWRVLSQMRGAGTYVLRADQLARLFLGAFPFLPVVGVMFDTIPKEQPPPP